MKPPAVICDLDGTLSSCAHRTHLVDLDDHMEPVLSGGSGEELSCPACKLPWPCPTYRSGKKDWNEFFDRLSCDAPVAAVVKLLGLMRDLDLEVLLCSGRPDDRRYTTEWWLGEHGIAYRQLFMRRQGDHRQDDIVKRELYETHIEPYWKIELVVDDRQMVVEMWRSLGLPVLQVLDPELPPILAGPVP